MVNQNVFAGDPYLQAFSVVPGPCSQASLNAISHHDQLVPVANSDLLVGLTVVGSLGGQIQTAGFWIRIEDPKADWRKCWST